jgi:hypothetical protein
MKWLLPVIAILLLSMTVLGEEITSYVDSPTTISTACIRNSQMRDDATATIIIYNVNGVEIVPQTNMTPSGNGTFSYTHVFTDIGGYSTRETCDFNGRLADGSTAINVIKPGFGNMQVLGQSVGEVMINRTVMSEWLLLLPNSTNTSQSSIRVLGGVCVVNNINGTAINANMTTIVTSDLLRTSFKADTDIGFAEDTNYEITCNISLSSGLMVNGVKNFVYINPHMTYLDYLSSLISSVGQILGIVQANEVKLNQTFDISNQTLQIVSNLNITGGGTNSSQIYEFTPDLTIFESQTYEDNPVIIGSRLTLGSLSVDNASCNIDIIKQSDASYVVSQQIVLNMGNGTYNYNWSTPVKTGSYSIKQNCSGGQLGTKTVYGATLATVSPGVEIQMLS